MTAHAGTVMGGSMLRNVPYRDGEVSHPRHFGQKSRSRSQGETESSPRTRTRPRESAIGARKGRLDQIATRARRDDSPRLSPPGAPFYRLDPSVDSEGRGGNTVPNGLPYCPAPVGTAHKRRRSSARWRQRPLVSGLEGHSFPRMPSESPASRPGNHRGIDRLSGFPPEELDNLAPYIDVARMGGSSALGRPGPAQGPDPRYHDVGIDVSTSSELVELAAVQERIRSFSMRGGRSGSTSSRSRRGRGAGTLARAALQGGELPQPRTCHRGRWSGPLPATLSAGLICQIGRARAYSPRRVCLRRREGRAGGIYAPTRGSSTTGSERSSTTGHPKTSCSKRRWRPNSRTCSASSARM